MRFSEPVQLPRNCTKWTEKNEGDKKLVFDYKPSNETMTLMYDQDVKVEITWEVVFVSVIDRDNLGVEHEGGFPKRRSL